MKSKQIPLSEYCDSINYGYTESASFENTGPKFLRITDIVKKTIDWDSVPYCKISKINFKKFELNDEDIVIARTGNTTGESNYIVNPPKAVFASYLIRLKINNSCDPLFVHYFLKSKTYTEYIYSILGEKSAQKNANAKSLTGVKTDFPSKKTQIKIAYILHTLTKKIENLQKQNKILEEIAQAIFKSWFIDFDGVTEFEDSELGKIPKGWKVTNIASFCRVRRGASPRPAGDPKYFGGDIPWIKIADVTRLSSPFLFTTKETVTKEGTKHSVHLPSGSLIVSNSGTIGISIFLARDGCIHDGWLYFENLKNISQEFIHYLISFLVKHLNHIADGTVQKNLNTTIVGDQKFVLSPSNTQKSFTQISRSILEKTKQNQMLVNNLKDTIDSLLPKLMSGEIRV